MSKLTTLQKARSLHSIARILGFKPSALSYILYIKEESSKYYSFEIPKRSGGNRTIQAPNPDLKCLQSRLSILLQDCIEEINKEKGQRNVISHGFRRNCSIVTNAKPHRNKRYVFNIDLNDFFGSINFGRVRGFFIKNQNFGLNEKVATVLAQIICYDNALPQGSPCSPVVSNLIAHMLDIKLSQLARKHDCTYSRYADDITFSSNMPLFPSQIAEQMDEHIWVQGVALEKVITKQGFSINPLKTRMQYKDSCQNVTGLVVNKKVNSRVSYRRTVRAMADSLFKTGRYYRKVYAKGAAGKVSCEQVEGTVRQLNGMLGFIDQIDLYNKSNCPDITLRDLSSRETLYRKFLFYKNFYSIDLPKIICEGKTDNIYIKEAIKSFNSQYPDLFETKENKINVNFLNYTKITNRLCFLSGGTSDLQKFFFDYIKLCETFKSETGKKPVIVLIDNDKGSSGVFASIKQKTKESKVDGSKEFYYLGKNLYVVVIPKIDGKDTMIEDYFDQTVLDTKLGNKKFSKSNQFNPKSQYGKHIFANEVVKKNSKTINFGRFSSILDRITQAIKDYERRG